MTDAHPLPPQTRLLTVADYDRLPDDGRRFELMFGEFYEMHAEGEDQDRLMTAADVERFSPEGPRYEIIGGIRFPVPDVELRHQQVLLRLLRALDRCVSEGGNGEVILQPPAVVLREHDVFRPDLVYVSSERSGIVGPKSIDGAPDLVVEIPRIPAIGRAIGRNTFRYGYAGVREYWLVNLEQEEITVCSSATVRGLDYPEPSPREGRVASSIVPGFSVDARQLFAGDPGQQLHS